MKVRIIKANGVKEFNKGISLEEFNKLIGQNMDYVTSTDGTTGYFNTYTDSGTNKMDYTYSSPTGTENPFFAHIYSTG
jgi:hypothetical protein